MKAFIRAFVGGENEMSMVALLQKSQRDLLGFLPSLLCTIPVSPTNYHDYQGPLGPLANWASYKSARPCHTL
ncbi:hypothetical protein PanWU01x14_312010 [Parasponia andersonii]|uniref:Uncharacterized protein n=1 Tax=Parasponia andersonii TaxID=3476 RepID=A0A2P5APT9_PARAD|nr:hypothetical protein PanWU01x14_312010 [Parasponia andersonii]